MQAVTYLAPALAPLALKLIDKYVFDDDRRTVPQIIQIPASPQCCCRCGQLTSDGRDSTEETCSTCCSSKSSSSSYRPSKHQLITKSSLRSSSTSDAYDKRRSVSPTCTRRLSDSTMNFVKKSEKKSISDADTLEILAGHMKHEIAIRHSKGKTSSHSSSKLGSIAKTSSKVNTAKTAASSGSRIKACCSKDIHGSSRKSNRDSNGSKVFKIS